MYISYYIISLGKFNFKEKRLKQERKLYVTGDNVVDVVDGYQFTKRCFKHHLQTISLHWLLHSCLEDDSSECLFDFLISPITEHRVQPKVRSEEMESRIVKG